MANVKIEPSDNIIFTLSYSNHDVCLIIGLFDTLSLCFRIGTNTLPLVSTNVYTTPHNPLCIKLPCHRPISSHQPLYLYSYSLCLSIVNALKLTKSRRRSKSNLIIIDFDKIDLHNVNYLPSSFDGDVLFATPVIIGNPSTYDRSMNAMNKMCDNHPWYRTKPINIQNDFGLSFMGVIMLIIYRI